MRVTRASENGGRQVDDHYGWPRFAVGAMAAVLGATVSYGAGPVQYWAFDDGSGATATNSVAGGNAGALVNFAGGGWDADVPAALAARSAGSLFFTNVVGQNLTVQHVSAGHVGIDSASVTDGATVSVWLKPSVNSGDMRLWSPIGLPDAPWPNPLGTVRLVDKLGVFKAFNPGDEAINEGQCAVVDDQWQHVGMVWKGSKLYAYLNGNPVGNISGVPFQFDRDGNGTQIIFGIGASYYNKYGDTYNGKMDDFALWNQALTPEQMQELAAGRSPLSLTPPSACAVPPRPLAEYRLDGNALDAKGRYNASAVNGVAFSGGAGDTPFTYDGNMAAVFDGADDEVCMPNVADLRPRTNSWTVALWFKTQNANQLGTLIANRNNNAYIASQISIYMGGTETGAVGTGNRIHPFCLAPELNGDWWESVTTTDYADGNWHHVALVCHANNQFRPILYLDGELTKAITLKTTVSVLDVESLEPWRIGSNGIGNCFAGSIDEVGLWDGALSSEQVAWLAQHSLSSISPRGTLIRLQ